MEDMAKLIQITRIKAQTDTLSVVRRWVFICVLIPAFGMIGGCNEDKPRPDPTPEPVIERTKSPAKFRSLGSAQRFYNVKGVKGKTLSIPLNKKEAVWFQPKNIRLGFWDKENKRFKIIDDSRYDAKAGTVNTAHTGNGVYAVFGLSRAKHIFDYQLKLCKLVADRRIISETFLPPDCTRILCPAFDASAWTQDWNNQSDIPIIPDDIHQQFGNICDQCFGGGGIGMIDFPECQIIPEDGTGPDILPPPNFGCNTCKRVCTDSDGDTLCNNYELGCLGTDPNKADTDNDGLSDSDEIDRGTDPKDSDTDDDGLSDGDEVNNRQTDPLNKDTDGDGLEDGWEALGYDSNGDGTRDINLSALGANPRKKDILVEIDWMFNDLNNDGDTSDVGENFRPNNAAINNVINTFANAPVPNPDGTNGINLIATISNGIQEVNLSGNLLAFDAAGNYTGFTTAYYNIKNANMTAGMAAISRYSLWIRNYNAAGNSGVAENIIADDFVVSLGLFTTVGGTLRQQQGTFMHELGHTVGLYHGGTQVVIAGRATYDRNNEPNYPSIMSYLHQFPGVVGTLTYGNPPVCASRVRGRLCFTQGAGPAWTYSQGQMANVNENCLSEPAGITAIAGPIDWNLDGDSTDNCVSVDLQADGDVAVQTDNNDWANLVYKFW